VIADAENAADWGVSFQKPDIDLPALRKRKQETIDTLTTGLKQLSSRRNVRLIQAVAKFKDSQSLRLESMGTETLEDEVLHFEHCILATGSSPKVIPTLQLRSARIMNSTGALQLVDVPESMLVVGGGYIGLEMATAYAAFGTKVSLAELTDSLLPGVDRNLVKPMRKRLEKKLRAIHLNTKVVEVEKSNDSIEVHFECPDKNAECDATVQRFSKVLVCVGRRPNSNNLGLENTKVPLDDHGFVKTDDAQRTTDEHVFAVGDVAGDPMLAHKAAHQGKVAVDFLAGNHATFTPKAIPAVVFTDPEIAWAGLTETDAKKQSRKVQVAQFPWLASGRAQTIGRTEGLTKWLIDPETQSVIGCGIVGPGAGDLIGEAVLAIEAGIKVDEIAKTIHPHPTFTETLGSAAEVHLGLATDIYKPKPSRS